MQEEFGKKDFQGIRPNAIPNYKQYIIKTLSFVYKIKRNWKKKVEVELEEYK